MPEGIVFRPYQIKMRDSVIGAFDRGIDSALVVMSTGTGKTVCSGLVIQEMIDRDKTTLFLAHRDILVKQAAKTFSHMGFETVIEMGMDKAHEYLKRQGRPDVVVGSVQSFHKNRIKEWPENTFGLIIQDESHHILAKSFRAILDYFKGYKLLGITATPARGDKKNLGTLFQEKVYEYGLKDAIKDGWLCPIKLRRCMVSVDLRGIRTIGGDYNQGDLEERIGPKVEVLARAFAKEIEQRRAVAFLPDIGSAMAFANVLEEIGVTAKYVSGSGGRFGMSKNLKNETLHDYYSDGFQVITCCDLLTEGWDWQAVAAVGIVRPTKLQTRLVQYVGRGTRIHHTKKDCLVVDFDWREDPKSRKLTTVYRIFDDGSLDDEVLEFAEKITKKKQKKGEDVDPLKVLDEAAAQYKREKKFHIALTGRTENYKIQESNPAGTAALVGMNLHRHWDLGNHGNPATEKQIKFLRILEVANPENLSKFGAAKLITKLKKRREKGLASPEQMRKLVNIGYTQKEAREMSNEAAELIIVRERSHEPRQDYFT